MRMILCKCPCGTLIPEFDNRGRKREYVKGHHGKGKHHSPETRKKIGDRNRGKIVSDATRQLQSETRSGENHPMFGKHHSPKTRQLISEKHKGQTHSPETKQKHREVWIKRKQDPNYDPKIYGSPGEKHPNYGKTPSDATRQKMREKHKGKTLSDKHKKNISEGIKGENHPMFGKTPSDEHRRNMSIHHADFSGENNPAWKGGIAYEPYCSIWTPWLKEEIKERDNYHCKNPNCTNEITKNNPLCTHHIDYDKKNCSTDNLITICRSCNTKANFNRDHWKNLYSNIITKVQLI